MNWREFVVYAVVVLLAFAVTVSLGWAWAVSHP